MSREIVGALIEDAIALLMNETPTGVASFSLSTLYQNWLRKRAKEAQEILLEEISSGHRLSGDFEQDCFFSLLFRYLNAVKRGTARRNLRLMAQIIDYGCRPQIEIVVDELAQFSEIVSSLDRDELAVLGAFWRNHHAIDKEVKSEEDRLTLFNETMSELVPGYFRDRGELMGVASALLRTGLVTIPSVWGGNRIDITPKFYKLTRLCRLETTL